MQFTDSPEEAAFRANVRELALEHFPNGGREFSEAMEISPDAVYGYPQWRQALRERGWAAPHWPKEYGGGGMSPGEQFIFLEELANHRIPSIFDNGIRMLGPTLIIHGSDEQKSTFLPRITSGEIVWCQGYSEPGSGSDLASLQTRAERDGDDFIINGQKIWTSNGHRADWMFMLARTDPSAPKHRGISMFLLDMKTPGVTVRPLVNMANVHHFNEVFFEDVRVPARQMVGEMNRGWYVGATLLDFERSNIGRSVELRNEVIDLVDYAKQAAPGQVAPSVRLELTERAIEAELCKLFSYRIISMQKRGMLPNHEASVLKNFRSESGQRTARTGIRLLGMYGNLYRKEPRAPMEARLAFRYLDSTRATIAAGTSEINRNVIATRGLGLPRG